LIFIPFWIKLKGKPKRAVARTAQKKFYVGGERVASGEFSRYIQKSPNEEGNERRSSAKTSTIDNPMNNQIESQQYI